MRKKKMCAAAAMVAGTLLLFQGPRMIQSIAAPSLERDFMVSFTATDDETVMIFADQEGSAAEGTEIVVTYPNQIVGSDGHIWKAAKPSPQKFVINGTGTQKFNVGYDQKEAIDVPVTPEEAGQAKLDKWLDLSWKAECEIMGNDPSTTEKNPSLVSKNKSESDSRLRNLISGVSDTGSHEIYLIGEGFEPTTVILATEDVVYSSREVDRFTLNDKIHVVVKVRFTKNYDAASCTHHFVKTSETPNSCLNLGREEWKCDLCGKVETISIPALGHSDADHDSVCDRCGKRTVAQSLGSVIPVVVPYAGADHTYNFTCVDDNYNGSGKMLYLSDSVIPASALDSTFSRATYNDSGIRNYLTYGFRNDVSISGALQEIDRTDGDGIPDRASILSKDEFDSYKVLGRIKPVTESYFLRTTADLTAGTIYHVDASGNAVATPYNTASGVRPVILLDKPVTDDVAERTSWQKGDVLMRKIGNVEYLFRCVDDNYSDNQASTRKAALFLCDTVIRSDIDSTESTRVKYGFGTNNNYKHSTIRTWLEANALDNSFGLEPIHTGVTTAYSGMTTAGEMSQMHTASLTSHEIGFQHMDDRYFSLSMEEAVRYKDELWSFDGLKDNPSDRLSPYSQGYYLRTPYYEEDAGGNFQYGTQVYVVDLANGNIHPAAVDSEVYGIRPAFALPQF